MPAAEDDAFWQDDTRSAWARAIVNVRGQSAKSETSREVGKEKGFALSPVRAREMRRFLERNGYEVVPGQHKHLRLRHDRHGDVLLPLRPVDNLSYVAVKQIAAALGMEPEELIRQSR
jgi:predicted RNA binding protein YcfA (HicA-like mRNA interferase family)